MDFIDCLNKQINDFKLDLHGPLWFDKVRHHSEIFGVLKYQYISLVEGYQIPFECDCKFCDQMNIVKSINSKLKNRFIDLLAECIQTNGYVSFDLTKPSSTTKFSQTLLEKYGFSDLTYSQNGSGVLSVKVYFSESERQQLFLARTNPYFTVNINFTCPSRSDVEARFDEKKSLSFSTYETLLLDLDNFSDYKLGYLEAIDGIISV
jgi:hypothetical protein